MTSKKVFIVGQDRVVTSMWYVKGFNIVSEQNDADILCFIGGSDINPSYYNQRVNPDAKVHIHAASDTRDENAWKAKKPRQLAVGICRGGQFINVMSGGKMLQHVDNHTTSHQVFDTLWNSTPVVASSHHQLMVPGEGAEVLAYSEGRIKTAMNDKGQVQPPQFESEVLFYESTNSLCYQGHPEWHPQSGTDYFFKLIDQVA